MALHDAYYTTLKAATDADTAYQAMLVAKHGKKAGDVRYCPSLQDAETRALRDTFVAASEAHHAEWLKTLPSYKADAA